MWHVGGSAGGGVLSSVGGSFTTAGGGARSLGAMLNPFREELPDRWVEGENSTSCYGLAFSAERGA